MRIAAVELEDLRRFAGRWRVGPFAPGLNVLAAPNEAGKSSLLAAIQAAIFLPHRSTAEAARALRRDDAGRPAVTLTLADGAGSWRISKRFAGPSGAAELIAPDGRRLAGDAAEEEVRRLFGVAARARGEAERGVWGALWVTQGASFAQPALDEPARATLNDALAAQVGVVTGGAGARRILARVRAELAELQSDQRPPRPRGALKRALDAASAAEEALAALRTRRAGVEALLGTVATLREAIACRTAARTEATLEGELTAAEAALRTLQQAAETRAAAVRAADDAARLALEAEDAVRRRRALAAEADARDRAAAKAGSDACEAIARRDAAIRAADSARDALAAARRAREAAAAALERARAMAALPAQAEMAKEAEKRAAAAAEALRAMTDAAAKRDAIALTRAVLRQIEAAADRLAAAQAAAVQAAPRLDIAVAQGGSVRLDGATLAPGETSHAVLAPMTVAIPGHATIRVAPPDRGDADPVLTARAQLAAALAAAGVPDLAAARAAAARREAFDDAARAAAARLTALAGEPTAEAVTALARRAAALEAALAERLAASGLECVPEAEAVTQALADAERALDQARAAEAVAASAAAPAEDAERAARETAVAAETAAAAAAHEAETIAARLAAAREGESDAALDARFAERIAAAQARRREVEALPQPDEAAAALARTRVERLRGALKAARDEAARDRESLAAAEAELRALEGDALDEAIAREAAAAALARREAEQLDARRAALVLLREAIDTAEREATARYLAPVSQRLQPWLEALLPGARALLDERLAVTGLTRDGRDESFDILSAGTQEQIAVLVRLAFADLLREQGRPAPVILDDALVFSDDARIERMFDILSTAAERMQIVVLTCRTALFSRLGGHRLALERMG